MTITPYMRFYPGDWKQKTQHLKAEARGVYLELILHIFSNGALPPDDEALARIGGVSRAEWRKIRPMLEPFFVMPGWRQVRAEEEREHARGRSKKAVEAANARWREQNYEKIEEKIAKKSEKKDETNPQVGVEISGETFEESAEALCASIANAYANAMLSESESESDRKKEAALNTRGRAWLDEIEGQLFEAAPSLRARAASSPGLLNLGPIVGCIDGGCDLELDVLPTVRAKAAGNPRLASWQWFVDAIWDTHGRRKAAAEPRAIPQAPANSQAPLAKDWRPSVELVDYGKSLGLSQADVDWTAEGLRNWAPGKARDDWPAVFRSWLLRKAEKDGKQPPNPNRMIEPHGESQQKAAAAMSARIAELSRS